MKGKNLLMKLALIIAVGSLIFAIVTLIRSIVIGQAILLSVVAVAGTSVATVVCGVMLYMASGVSYEEDEDDEEDAEAADEDSRPVIAEAPAPVRRSAEPPQRTRTSRRPRTADVTEVAGSADAAAPADDAPQSPEDIEAEIDRILAELGR